MNIQRFRIISLALLALGLAATAVRAEDPDEVLPALDIGKFPKDATKPKPIKQPSPLYPYAMSRAGLTGQVKVSFVIDKQGNVRDAFVIESNNPWFERPALNALRQWKFTPGEVDGRLVNTRAAQRIDFNLDPAGRPPELWNVTKGKKHDKQPPEFQWETPPIPKMTMFPVYPFEPLRAGTPGKVRIAYVVGPQGRVVAAKVVEATTPEFGAAVAAMFDAWRFKPAKLKDGQPAYARLAAEYEFKPNGRADVPVSDTASQILRTVEKKPEDIAALKELDRPLKPISQRPPAYPSSLEKAGAPGTATIEFYVDKNGDAQLPRIVSSTAPEFGYAAAQAIATWRFEPAKRGGKTVIVRTQIPLNFSPTSANEH